MSRYVLLAPDIRKTMQAGDLPVTQFMVTECDILVSPPPRPTQRAGTVAPLPDHLNQSGRMRIVPSSLLSVNLKNEERDIGLPRDMLDMLQSLEDLADWVRAASRKKIPAVSRNYLCGNHHLLRWMSPTSRDTASCATPSDGKVPMQISNDSRSTQVPHVNASNPATLRVFSIPIVTQGCRKVTDSHSHNTTESLLVGGSRSVITHSEHRGPYFQQPPPGGLATSLTNHSIWYHRTMDACSAPFSSRTVHRIGSLCGKVPRKSSLQRSKWKTTAIPPAIPADHVPVESPYSRRKRVHFPCRRF
ncbi:hypothetical protein EDC04DRAFT_2669976 [Pisolithus marmoratus]|nr:hypothetical protein EDC04DRAFT_2669976 [Pisolithus marmoratus]